MAITGQISANPARLAGYAAVTLAAAALGSLTVKLPPPLAAGGIAFLTLLGLVALIPEAGLLVAVAAVYLNVPVIAFKFYGVPQLAAAAVPIVLLLPAMGSLITRRQRLVIDHAFVLMLLFLGAVLLASFTAIDKDLALQWIAQYLSEGLLLYFFLVNLVRSPSTLGRIVGALVLAGALLGAMSIFQEVTGSYEQTFGGLAQRNFGRETADAAAWDEYQNSPREMRLMHRAMGPIGDPNRYAQILLVLLPLAWWQIRHARHLIWKLAAKACGVLILGGILLTYSRGAFLTIVLLMPIALVTRFVRWKDLLWVGIGLSIVCLAVAPGYLQRMNTIKGLTGLYSPTANAEPDAVQRSRATEMLGAAGVFLDHPLIGVGPGQYSKIYSVDYMSRADFQRRIKVERRAHSLYLELAAETGLVGFALFLGIAGVLAGRLGLAARRLRVANPRPSRTDAARADLAIAFVIAIGGYFASALFLHFSYQRYYWLLLALAGAAVQLLARPPRPARHALIADATLTVPHG
jgi:putative inorganic carbon (hco3(-)) transporter